MARVIFKSGKELRLTNPEAIHMMLYEGVSPTKRIENIEFGAGFREFFLPPQEGLPFAFPFTIRWPWRAARIKQIVKEEYGVKY